MTTTNVTFRLRRDTTANWDLYNPVLQAGEIGIDTTLNKFKIGNGVATFSALVFANVLATDLTSAITTHNNATTNIHGIADTTALATKTYVDTAVSGLASTAAETYVPDSLIGNPDGIATLDENGLIPLGQLANLVDSAPTALNTLNELAAALGDDANFSTTVTNSLGTLSSQVASFDARIVSLELDLGI
jgi:hypothetical protein